MQYLVKFCSGLFALILIGFAGLQLNDPDPIIWVGFYLICAAVPIQVIFGKWWRSLFLVALTACCAELVLSAPGAYNYYLHSAQEPLMQGMNPDKPYIEQAREFLGALIALGLVLISAWLSRFTLHK